MFRRADALAAGENAVVGTYVHNALGGRSDMGGICAAVSLEAEGAAPGAGVEALAQQIAMHVVAARPQFATIESVPAEAADRERAILEEQARNENATANKPKPDAVIAKIVDGRMAKLYKEAVLEEQVAMIGGDDKKTVRDLLADASEEHGARISLGGFLRYQVGGK